MSSFAAKLVALLLLFDLGVNLATSTLLPCGDRNRDNRPSSHVFDCRGVLGRRITARKEGDFGYKNSESVEQKPVPCRSLRLLPLPPPPPIQNRPKSFVNSEIHGGTTPPPSSSSIPDLILSLEQAIMAAKQLPSTADPIHLLQIQSSLHHAHHHLSAFLSRPHLPLPIPLPPAENSLSSASAAAAAATAAEPMQLGDDDENDDVEQVSSRGMVDGVEEKMRNCFVKKKRRKRRLSLSPSLAAEEVGRRLSEEGFGVGAIGEGFDPYATRLRALELVYQFHG